MPAASTLKSIWPVHKLPLALLSGTLLSCRPGGAAAQNLEPPPAQLLSPAIAQAIPARREDIAELLLQIDVNQQRLDETVLVLRRKDGTILIAGEDLDRWRLRRPGTPPYEHEGKLYYPAGALPALKIQVDERKQTLAIAAEPQAFTGTVAAVSAQRYPPPVLPQPGGFLNYTLSGTHSAGESTYSGLFEAGFFSRYGVFTNSLLAPELTHSATWLRLDSTYAIDYPEALTSLRLGDTITSPGAWGRAVRFGGIQFGTNFATQPGFIRFPVMQAAGAAALPSTVDVFVNNALVQRSSVPPGPFSIQNIPVVTGSGEVRVVVRDLLGREQVITQPFYSSATLLKQGLEDYSYELGAVRNNFAVSSNDYGQGVATATYRRGITDTFTSELRGEATRDVQAGGLSSALRAGNFGVLSGTFALSRTDQGTGRLLGYGVEHLTDSLSMSLQTQLTSPDFRQTGMTATELPRRRQTVGNVNYSMGTLGSLSLSYAIQQFRDQPTAEVSTLTYAVPLGKVANLSLSALRVYGPTGATTLFLSFIVPLGELTSATFTRDRTRSAATGSQSSNNTLAVQKNPPLGEGYGYRLQDRNGDFLGNYSLQTGVGTYVLEESLPKAGANATRVGIAGGIGVVGGYPFLSRSISDSFGVVRVADYPNVRVLQDNQVVARTDAQGYAVLPRMRAYDRNQVSLDQNDLPFDATLGSLRLDAVPYFRSGVLLDFPVHRVRAGTLHVMLEDGRPLPSGALARIEGKEKEFPVALRGEAYLEGFEASNRLIFTWRGQNCIVEVPYSRTDDPLPELGTFVCEGVKP